MAKKGEAVRSVIQSNEFVQDSSDEDMNTNRISLAKPSNQENGVSKPLSTKRKLSGTNISSREQARSATSSLNGIRTGSHEVEDNSDSESESDASTSSSASSNSTPSTQQPQQKARKSKKRGPALSIAPKTFHPPEGFHEFGLAASDYASQSHDIFNDLSTKQIWHISAPASLPITSIKTLDIEAALRGDAICTKDGISYSMESLPVHNEMLLIPDGPTARYSQSKITLARSFQLREMTHLPNQKVSSTGPSTNVQLPQFFAKQLGQRKAPRQQPQGLKMRYVPYGVQSSTQRDDHDVAMVDQPVVFEDIETQSLTERSKKKSKKQNSSLENDDDITTEISTNPTSRTTINSTPKSPDSKSISDKHSQPMKPERKKRQKSKLVNEEML